VRDDAHTAVRLWRAGETPNGTPRRAATAYDAATVSFQDLTRRYIAELEKPRIRLPSLVGFVGAVGGGVVVG